MWDDVARRMFYFVSTSFSQRQLDLLVIWLTRRRKSLASRKQAYCLMQNDCLEFSKDIVRELASLTSSEYQNEIESKLRSLTISKDSVLVSSEFTSRNVTVFGLSVGVSYQSAVTSTDVIQEKQQQQRAEVKKKLYPLHLIILSNIVTALAVAFYFKNPWK